MKLDYLLVRRIARAIDMFENYAKGMGRFMLQSLMSKCNNIHQQKTSTVVRELYRKNTKMQYNFMVKPMLLASEEERKQYNSMFPEVVSSLANSATTISSAKQHCKNLLYYTIPGELQDPGIFVLTCYKKLTNSENITPETCRVACIVGWCIDMILSSLRVYDDILDGSEDRHGKPCWYKKENVGLHAFNDTVLVQHGTYLVLKETLSHSPVYTPIIACFHKMTLDTTIGQFLEKVLIVNGKIPLESFTMDNYRAMMEYKSTHPIYMISVTLGMYLSGKYDSVIKKQVDAVLLDLGLYYAAQNDVLDSYSDPKVYGKSSTDIKNGKCTWLIVQAVQQATVQQKKILSKHYGNSDNASKQEILNVFQELELLSQFFDYQEESFNRTCKNIQKIGNPKYKELLFMIAENAYGKTFN